MREVRYALWGRDCSSYSIRGLGCVYRGSAPCMAVARQAAICRVIRACMMACRPPRADQGRGNLQERRAEHSSSSSSSRGGGVLVDGGLTGSAMPIMPRALATGSPISRWGAVVWAMQDRASMRWMVLVLRPVCCVPGVGTWQPVCCSTYCVVRTAQDDEGLASGRWCSEYIARYTPVAGQHQHRHPPRRSVRQGVRERCHEAFVGSGTGQRAGRGARAGDTLPEALPRCGDNPSRQHNLRAATATEQRSDSSSGSSSSSSDVPVREVTTDCSAAGGPIWLVAPAHRPRAMHRPQMV